MNASSYLVVAYRTDQYQAKPLLRQERRTRGEADRAAAALLTRMGVKVEVYASEVRYLFKSRFHKRRTGNGNPLRRLVYTQQSGHQPEYHLRRA